MREGEKLLLEHLLHHPQGGGAVDDGEMAKWLFAAEASGPLILSSVLPTLGLLPPSSLDFLPTLK